MGMNPQLTDVEARKIADVIIDCTPAGNVNKREIYLGLDQNKGFIAQGSEHGFGVPYVNGINGETLKGRYIQIGSCNVHSISALIDVLGMQNGSNPSNIIEANFQCIRRANDVSQNNNFLASPQVGKANNQKFGTHHARDVYELFKTKGLKLDLFSRAMKINTQYMHTIGFDMYVQNANKDDLVDLVKSSKKTAVTYKDATCLTYFFGNEFGINGKILNHSVIPIETLHVRDSRRGIHISGYCFTPQDGNSIVSSVKAAMWLLDPTTYQKDTECLDQYLFDEV
jgi:glyceraldehyde-3-phosphate dehydrogenase (NAD(P))